MWKERLLTLLRDNPLLVVLSAIGLLLILISIGWAVVTENKSEGVIIEEAASTEKEEGGMLVVDVSGAVLKPGVYRLKEGARLHEGLIAAGGLSEDADREYVSKSINLAAKITDGAKIYIPTREESITHSSSVGRSGQAGSGAVAGVVTGLINVNTASERELDTLPGIGPVTAAKIVNNRPYGSVEELRTKRIVGQKVFGQIKEKISVY